jgi:hypothetical protein
MPAEPAICPCVACGKPAAEFFARAAGEGADDESMRDRDRLLRRGWFGTCTVPQPLADALTLVTEMRADRVAPLAAADPDLFGFFCRECGKTYCGECWDIDPPQFDGSFYDCTSGTCPAGHVQIVDD